MLFFDLFRKCTTGLNYHRILLSVERSFYKNQTREEEKQFQKVRWKKERENSQGKRNTQRGN